MATARVKLMMNKLGCSEEEAMDIINYDKLVDKGKPTQYDLTEEQKKVEKAMKNSDTHAKTEKKVSKARENPEKENIISNLSEFLAEFGADSVEITNKTREIVFKIGEKNYKLVVSETKKK